MNCMETACKNLLTLNQFLQDASDEDYDQMVYIPYDKLVTVEKCDSSYCGGKYIVTQGNEVYLVIGRPYHDDPEGTSFQPTKWNDVEVYKLQDQANLISASEVAYIADL